MAIQAPSWMVLFLPNQSAVLPASRAPTKHLHQFQVQLHVQSLSIEIKDGMEWNESGGSNFNDLQKAPPAKTETIAPVTLAAG